MAARERAWMTRAGQGAGEACVRPKPRRMLPQAQQVDVQTLITETISQHGERTPADAHPNALTREICLGSSEVKLVASFSLASHVTWRKNKGGNEHV